mmetsp:Transcript_1164/g.2584  ORF Transcript_1164/g.2584 Transcript_1164/m.2584 type:complete len:244 (-) Transcript_1164:131-862(-)|eukprot:CAMPEP_0206462164 /NCGR_PEP_ID=MMETSP0324_2-20121206/25819_1 /ASSEMBLY_ACC=CAM_ASM_000836 /TAXON_ID=2866 /ORGANISM="Crypthecodinium cohnii, Strain Seligo" /LENGTH=243 /DNA_ID=CAMNT_0053934275 /DNA_START=239 /DNA_END=970 /DNA_ORIENTATION=+
MTRDRSLSAGLMETYMERFELSKEEIMAQKDAFDLIDVDKSGMITLAELKKFNETFHAGFSDKEIQDQFAELDIDGNGGITFLEYLKVYVKGEYGREVHIGLDHIEKIEPPVMTRYLSKGLDRQGSDLSLEPIKEAVSCHNLLAQAEDAEMLIMKLSAKRSLGFHVNAVRRFLQGTEDKAAVPSLRLSALGDVVSDAATVAVRMQTEGLAEIVKIQTLYPDMPNGRGCPQIIVDLEVKAKEDK